MTDANPTSAPPALAPQKKDAEDVFYELTRRIGPGKKSRRRVV